MSENSAIEWTKHTFNPWLGCIQVSPGCENCYAEALVTKRFKLPVWGPAKTTVRKRTGAANWREPLRWNRAAEKEGGHDFVFCSSLADVFEDHPSLNAWREELFDLIEQTPHLTWQLLTKRPRNINGMLSVSWRHQPRANVWFGATVEDTKRASERIAYLLDVPAAVRFLSVEPLLEPLDLTRVPVFEQGGPSDLVTTLDALRGHVTGSAEALPSIGWVIVGGESGPGARPFHTGWARSLVAQCRGAGVPVFVKQMGARPFDGAGTVALRHKKGANPDEWPEDLRVRELPEVGA